MTSVRTTRVLAAVAVATLVGSPLAAASASSAHAGSQRSAGAVQKVIQMLTDMSVKAKQEMRSEEVAFAEFSTWCTQETASLKNEIKKNGEEMESLTTGIGKLTSDVRALGKDIASLNGAVAKHDSNMKAETAQRKEDHSAFLEESKDYSESVDALDRAIDVLTKQSYDRKGTAAALLQLAGREQLPAKARSIITAFLGVMSGAKGKEPDFMSYDAPEANAYEFQSTGIIELLKKLRDEFSTKLGECQKEEMNSKHAYDMIVMDLKDSIENSKKDMSEKTAESQRKAEKAAKNKKQLASTSSVKAENENTLSATTTQCEEKTLSFKEKQKLRGEEIEAIGKAVEILSSPEVAGHAEKYLSMAQVTPVRTALAHLREDRSAAAAGNAGIRRRVREFLASEGRRLRSQRLGLLAQKLEADPFVKVKKMIESMLTRLLEEANQDSQHEGFCDTEMGKSRITRNKLSADIDGLTADVEDGKATIMRLTESTGTLSAEIAELVKSMAEVTEMRSKEKAQNKVTVEDAQAAQRAVMAATAVLKDFYAKALTATALLQAPTPRRWGLKTGVKMGTEEWKNLDKPGAVDKGHKEGMQTFGDTYQGQQDEEQYGVLGLLEVIMSDFSSLEADTTAAEVEAQKSYERFMAESKKSQAVKERKVEMNKADRSDAEAKMQSDTADLKATQDELLAAERYHAKLVPQCQDQGMTYGERTKARADEIASLKEALKILSSEDIATSA